MTFNADGTPTLERMLKGAAHETAAREGCNVEQTPEWRAMLELEAWRNVMPQYEFRDGGIHRKPESLPPFANKPDQLEEGRMGIVDDAERRQMIAQANREYHPCWNGLHVCGQTADEERPLTVANVPGLSATKFTRLREQFAVPYDNGWDLLVDLFLGGDAVDEFPIRQQSLAALLEAAQA